MSRTTAMSVAAFVSVLMVAGACRSPTPVAGSASTVATEPERTTTTHPYAVPAVIDDAYVNRVLAGLDAVMGDVLRLTMTAKAIVPEAYDRLKAIYADSQGLMQDQIDLLQSGIRRGFPTVRVNPGNSATTVSQLISGSASCIFVKANRDYTSVSAGPSTAAGGGLWIALRPADPSRDPSGYNPTRWALFYEGFRADQSEPGNKCVG